MHFLHVLDDYHCLVVINTYFSQVAEDIQFVARSFIEEVEEGKDAEVLRRKLTC